MQRAQPFSVRIWLSPRSRTQDCYTRFHRFELKCLGRDIAARLAELNPGQFPKEYGWPTAQI